MNLAWISYEDLCQFLSSKHTDSIFTETTFKYFKKVASHLTSSFPSGREWLDAPNESKKMMKRDAGYIVFWATMRGLFADEKIRLKLYEFLNMRRSPSILEYARVLGYLDDREILQSNSAAGCLALATIFLGKPFRDFTEEDLELFPIPELIKNHKMHFNMKKIMDIRFELGYSSSPGRSLRKDLFSKIKDHPKYGTTVSEFENYLSVVGYAEGSKKMYRSAFRHMLSYLDQNNLDNFASFQKIDFQKLFDFVENQIIDNKAQRKGTATGTSKKTIFYRLSIMKQIFEWGIGKSFFPPTLEFPIERLKELGDEATTEYHETDGHSFKNVGDAELFVTHLKNYQPVDELDELCHKYWLVQICCPARFHWILNLEAFSCMHPMANQPKLQGLTAFYPDKAGNVYGESIIFDNIGVEAVKFLQRRALEKGFKPLRNRRNKYEYVHLFQLEKHPFILQRNHVYNFAKKLLNSIPDLKDKYSGIGAHKFRNHILKEVAVKTRNMEAVRIAALHRDSKMSKLYLRSKLNRECLIFTMESKHGSTSRSAK